MLHLKLVLEHSSVFCGPSKHQGCEYLIPSKNSNKHNHDHALASTTVRGWTKPAWTLSPQTMSLGHWNSCQDSSYNLHGSFAQFTDAQGCTSSDRSMPYFLQTAWQEWEGVGSVLPIWSHSNCSPRQVQLWLKESCVDEVKEPNEPMAFWQIISPKSWKKVSTMPWTKREESRNTQNHWNHQHPIHSHRPWIPSTEWVAAWWKDFSFSCHLKGPLPYMETCH